MFWFKFYTIFGVKVLHHTARKHVFVGPIKLNLPTLVLCRHFKPWHGINWPQMFASFPVIGHQPLPLSADKDIYICLGGGRRAEQKPSLSVWKNRAFSSLQHRSFGFLYPYAPTEPVLKMKPACLFLILVCLNFEPAWGFKHSRGRTDTLAEWWRSTQKGVWRRNVCVVLWLPVYQFSHPSPCVCPGRVHTLL